jgi:hypothetical protein
MAIFISGRSNAESSSSSESHRNGIAWKLFLCLKRTEKQESSF